MAKKKANLECVAAFLELGTQRAELVCRIKEIDAALVALAPFVDRSDRRIRQEPVPDQPVIGSMWTVYDPTLMPQASGAPAWMQELPPSRSVAVDPAGGTGQEAATRDPESSDGAARVSPPEAPQ